MSGRRQRPAPCGDMIPGTAVSLPRRSPADVLTATSRPIPSVPDQGDLVDHWRECGLLDEQQCAAMVRETS